MKILIPMSGGFDSTYLLWKALTETDHEVHVIHVSLSNGTPRSVPENRACKKIQTWLTKNCRPIESWVTGDVTATWGGGGLLDYVYMAPVILSRVMSIHDVDEIWMGANLEEYELYELGGFNDADAWFKTFIESAWHTGCSHCPEGEPFKGHAPVSLVHPYRDIRKRVAMAETPKALLKLSWSCHYPSTEVFPGKTKIHYYECGFCTSCLLRQGKTAKKAFNFVVDYIKSNDDVKRL